MIRQSTGHWFSGFHRLGIEQRIARLVEHGALSESEAAQLRVGGYTLGPATANRMIENVVGVFALPFALLGNLRVNGRDYLVPMVVEEPSIVAAASAACALARRCGGFEVRAGESLLIGQIELRALADPALARRRLAERRDAVLGAANDVHPNLARRGGGVVDFEVRDAAVPDSLIVHLLVDTRDAMGANLVNTLCEALAPLLESVTGGRAGLRILSNYAERSVVGASVRLPAAALAWAGQSGEQVRDAIVAADRFAAADVYRAVTHNKGIMNGIDPIAIATGNDWRAIEAGVHAWAARGGRYRGLTHWRVGDDGSLVGSLELPLKPGTAGASMTTNPGVRLALGLLGVSNSAELAGVMAAVGLAQNFAAIRALGTEGIQRGHMRLHARGVVTNAGVAPEHAHAVEEALIASGEIKEWKAREIYAGRLADAAPVTNGAGAAGKLILGGEHAVVYGRHALALPIPDAMRASVSAADEGMLVRVPAWGLEQRVDAGRGALGALVERVLEDLGIAERRFVLQVDARYPSGVGLGGSASLAVACIRALASHAGIDVDDESVNAIAYRCEQIAHGNPSGIDNTIACYGRALLFRRGDTPVLRDVVPGTDLDLVVAVSSKPSATSEMVARVAAARERDAVVVDAVFDAMDAAVLAMHTALVQGDLVRVGELMNTCHGLVAALGLSTPEIEQLLAVARAAGALGAKVTGAGGGGAVVALADPDRADIVEAALRAGGQPVYRFTVPGPRAS